MIKSKITIIDNKISVDLYHGTSTLFLDSIIENGLGGVNPVTEWNLIELCKEVYKLKNTEFHKNNELMIDVAFLNNGYYTILFKTNFGNYSQKLVKEYLIKS